jgi:ubiquitin thioesterase OTU1
MADDNSCLFTAVGGALKIPDPAARLRKEVTDYIREHPAEYTKAILENQEPAKYIERILNKENWGGYIELDIISKIYSIQIAVVVVEHMNVTLVGEGFQSRIMIMWSGPHYDRIVFVPEYLGSNADTDFDETRWDTDDDEVLEKAKELAGKLKAIHYFTNLTQSLWSCSSCDWMGEGEQGMKAHMKQTRHTGFQEIEVT